MRTRLPRDGWLSTVSDARVYKVRGEEMKPSEIDVVRCKRVRCQM